MFRASFTSCSAVFPASIPSVNRSNAFTVAWNGQIDSPVTTLSVSTTLFDTLMLSRWGRVVQIDFATTARTSNLTINSLIPAGWRPSNYGCVVYINGHLYGVPKGGARCVIDGSGTFTLQVENSTSQVYQGSLIYLQQN